MDKEKKDILFFGYGLGMIAVLFALLGTWRHGCGLPQQVEWGCAAVFIVVTSFCWEELKPGYKIWMTGAHFIGGIVTTIILSTVFFLLFAPIGIFFRVIGKDHLDRQIDKAAPTYWYPRAEGVFSKERYEQQF